MKKTLKLIRIGELHEEFSDFMENKYYEYKKAKERES